MVLTSLSMQMSSSSKLSKVEMLSKPSSAVEGEGWGLSKISGENFSTKINVYKLPELEGLAQDEKSFSEGGFENIAEKSSLSLWLSGILSKEIEGRRIIGSILGSSNIG